MHARQTHLSLLFILATSSLCIAEDSFSAIQSATFAVTLDSQARVVSLSNPATGKEYVLCGPRQALLSLREFNSDTLLAPVSMACRKDGDATLLTIMYTDGLQAEVKALGKPTHVTFTLTSLNKDNTVEAVIWGPFKTRLPAARATALGVVRGDGYSIGILGLNIQTLAGFESTGRCRFGNAVQAIEGPTPGSMLQAFTVDRTKKGVGSSGTVAYPIPGETVLGSSLALYGCETELELDRVGEIEISENLPHPMLDGVWSKKLPRKYHSKILTAFSEQNIDECIELAKQANVHVVRMKGLFESWGHYRVNQDRFPDGLDGLKRCVEKAKQEDILLGAHFRIHINPRDPYVTPDAHPHLAVRGETTAATDISADASEVILADDDVVKFYTRKRQKAASRRPPPPLFARIGSEIVEYSDVSKAKPYRLLNCKRGTHDTTIRAHQAGTPIAWLETAVNGTAFLPDVFLAEEMGKNLAELVNATGLPHLELDGFDHDCGHWLYTRKVFVKILFDLLENKSILHGGSDLLPYHWHYVNLISWGESRTTFRGSMLEYRFKVAEFLKTNQIPIGLGQYKLDKLETVEDLEWLCARAAGNDAGWDLYLSVDGLKGHPLRDELLQVMNTWQTAYIEDIFTPEQKQLLQDVTREFKLNKSDGGTWELKQTGTWTPVYSERDKSGAAPEQAEKGQAIVRRLALQPAKSAIAAQKPPEGADQAVDSIRLEFQR